MDKSQRIPMRKIFSKDFSKVGKKIMLNYFIVILVTTMVFMLVSSISFSRLLNQQTKEELFNDANLIASQITMAIDYQLSNSSPELFPYENSIIIRQKIFSDYSLGISDVIIPRTTEFTNNRLATTYIVVLDKEKQPIFTSYNTKETSINPVNPDRNQYFVEERILKSTDGVEPMGYLVMLSQKEDLSAINGLIGTAGLFGVLAALTASIFLSIFFERNFISPVNILRNNISSFSLDEDKAQWQEFETEDELSDINKDLIKLVNKLKQYDKQQKEFFQNTSHELKTPLMSIQGYAEAIKDGVLEKDSVEEGLDIIIDESIKLRDTLNSIVYLSKVGEKENEDRDILLWEFVEEMRYRLTGISRERSIQIINLIGKDIQVSASDEELDRIFSNLLSNAVRYAKSKVTVESLRIETGHMVITVTDDGRGFENKEETQIFDRFYKGKGGHTGLGLSIVKSILESKGWAIKAGNAYPQGARFEITIPPQRKQ